MARFTDAQLQAANSVDLSTFLRSRGEKLIKSGSEYRWVYRDGNGEHDSVTVRGGEWFDHRRQLGGDAIGFLQEFCGMGFREAVETLIGQRSVGVVQSRSEIASPPAREFALPPKAVNMHRLYAYLCKTRCIDHEIVTHFVRAGLLYEDAERHNAVFVAADEEGVPRGGMKKSTLSDSSFRQTIAGSDTRFAFQHKGSSGRLFVFEAAVDMLSFITLHRENWRDQSYIALDGLSSKPLLYFLSANTDTAEVCLCLDNDAAGIDGAKRISKQLKERGYTEVCTFFPDEKDWNEALVRSYDAPEMEVELCQQLS